MPDHVDPVACRTVAEFAERRVALQANRDRAACANGCVTWDDPGTFAHDLPNDGITVPLRTVGDELDPPVEAAATSGDHQTSLSRAKLHTFIWYVAAWRPSTDSALVDHVLHSQMCSGRSTVRTNRLKEVGQSDGLALGVSLTIGDPLVAEIVGAAAPDFVMIDAQHAPLTPEVLQRIMIALRTSAATSLVRVAANDGELIGQALDLGAEGVIVPGVVDGPSCAKAVAATRYAPRGNRGFGPRRAARLEGGRTEYLARADDEIAAVVMLEHVGVLDELDEILTTPELDAVMVGPADLAVSMGHLTEPGHADVKAAIETVLKACKRHRVPFGIFAAAESSARAWTSKGAAFVVIGADLQFLDQGLARTKEFADELRADSSA